MCISGMAINFQAAPIVMKLNFNYSFQGSYGWRPGALKIICLFVNLGGEGGLAGFFFFHFFFFLQRAMVASAGDFCDNQTIIMCGDAAKHNMDRCH